MDGFNLTVSACKALGLELGGIPPGVLQMFYRSGAAFAEHSDMTEDEMAIWRDSVVCVNPNRVEPGKILKMTVEETAMERRKVGI